MHMCRKELIKKAHVQACPPQDSPGNRGHKVIFKIPSCQLPECGTLGSELDGPWMGEEAP